MISKGLKKKDILESGYPEELIELLGADTDLNKLTGAANGKYLFFTDTVLSPGMLERLIEALEEEKLRAAAFMSFEEGSAGNTRYSPLLENKALLIDREVFISAGGFDSTIEEPFIDLGLRLWVMGHKTVKILSGDKSFKYEKYKKPALKTRLMIAYKNFGHYVFSALAVIMFQQAEETSFKDTGIDPESFDLAVTGGSTLSGDMKISSEYRSLLSVIRSYIKEVPSLKDKREYIQSRRKRLDKSIFLYFKDEVFDFFINVDEGQKDPLGMKNLLENSLRIKVCVISNEIVAKSMAGPGIRAFNLSEQLSKHFDVRLMVPNNPDVEAGFKISKIDDELLRRSVGEADIVITSGTTVAKYKFLKDSGKIMVFDLYDPYNIASLVEYENLSFAERMEANSKISSIINFQIKRADHLVCATQRQKDLWTGMLKALGRFEVDDKKVSSPESMISIVPFGLPDTAPERKKKAIKGIIEGIEEEDFVILWGGGIYNWFDPIVLIKAMDILKDDYPDIKLYFMGVKHPNPEVKELKMAGDAYGLCKDLGLEKNNVFFNFGWIEYESRADYLLDSDIGIITYPGHIETRFAFRTRILDYLWAGLPVISSEGDYLSSMIAREGLGISVKNSPKDVADAIISLYDDKGFYCDCRANIQKIKEGFTWSKVSRPLIEYCKDPLIR